MADPNEPTDQSTISVNKQDPYRESLQTETQNNPRPQSATGNARPSGNQLRVGTPPDYEDSDIIDVQSFTRTKYLNNRPQSTPSQVQRLEEILPAVSGQINIQWAGSIEPEFASFRVYRSPANFNGDFSIVQDNTDTTYQVGGLIADEDYYLYVTAMDNAGNESIQSEVIKVTITA
jgi:hypothetical protein